MSLVAPRLSLLHLLVRFFDTLGLNSELNATACLQLQGYWGNKACTRGLLGVGTLGIMLIIEETLPLLFKSAVTLRTGTLYGGHLAEQIRGQTAKYGILDEISGIY